MRKRKMREEVITGEPDPPVKRGDRTKSLRGVHRLSVVFNEAVNTKGGGRKDALDAGNRPLGRRTGWSIADEPGEARAISAGTRTKKARRTDRELVRDVGAGNLGSVGVVLASRIRPALARSGAPTAGETPTPRVMRTPSARVDWIQV